MPSIMSTGLRAPASRRARTILPGCAPGVVRASPMSSAASLVPDTLMRANGRARARATVAPSEDLPVPGGPTRHSAGPGRSGLRRRTARYSMMRSLALCMPSWPCSSTCSTRSRSASSETRASHGIDHSQCRYARTCAASGEPAGRRRSRSISRCDWRATSAGSGESGARELSRRTGSVSCSTGASTAARSWRVARLACRVLFRAGRAMGRSEFSGGAKSFRHRRIDPPQPALRAIRLPRCEAVGGRAAIPRQAPSRQGFRERAREFPR